MKNITTIKTGLARCSMMLGIVLLTGCEPAEESVVTGQLGSAARANDCSIQVFGFNHCYTTGNQPVDNDIYSPQSPSPVADDIYILDTGIVSGMFD